MPPDSAPAAASALRAQIDRFLDSIRRENVSGHTLRAYGGDLAQFAEFIERRPAAPDNAAAIDLLAVREWLGDLFRRRLSPVTMRRKLASLRSFFEFAVRGGEADRNTARLLATPKTPAALPRVMSAEQVGNLLDSAARGPRGPSAARDLAILEMLYGCGLRVSELVGINLDDIDFSERWLRVRGKGRKERQVPLPSKAAEALNRYLAVRPPSAKERAVFVNPGGRRLTDRTVRNIVKTYATHFAGDSSIHPHSFRHAYATHLLADGADLRAIQELLGHARLSTTQKYTKVTLTELMAVYDKAHPRA